MKIYLISHTKEPLLSIAAAIKNIGIGQDIKTLDDITRKEAETVFKDTVSSFLDSPLEFASFNFFWEDIPLFMRSELERARVGWSYAERSLRFYKADSRNPIEKIDWDMFPGVQTIKQREALLMMMEEHMQTYQTLQSEYGLHTQEARNAIGPWFGTALQTSSTYRALRNTMALRLSSQAHPAWKKAANQIKDLVTTVEPVLGKALTDICDIQGRCVWQSKLDRPCDDCAKRGRVINHVHDFGKGQCTCGELKQ